MQLKDMKKCTIMLDGAVNKDQILPLSNDFLSNFQMDMRVYANEDTPDSLRCFLRYLHVCEDDIKLVNRSFYEVSYVNKQVPRMPCGRCNLVSLKHGKLEDFTSGKTEIDAFTILKSLHSTHPSLIPTRGYRAGIILQDITFSGLSPHMVHGYRYEDYLEMMPPVLNQWICSMNEELQNIDTSLVLWPYAISSHRIQLPTFENACFIGAVDALLGASKCMGIKTISMPSMTGSWDTDLKVKLELTMKELSNVQHVMLHINGADEAAHRKEGLLKNEFLHKVETVVLKPLFRYCREHGIPMELMVDHICDAETGMHHSGKTPFYFIK